MTRLAIAPVAPIGASTSPAFVDYENGRGALEMVTTPRYAPSSDGDALRDLRVRLNLSLGDAARAFGCSVVEASGLERGSHATDFAEARRRLEDLVDTDEDDDSDDTDGDEDRGVFQFGGLCESPGCINFGNHFAPDECETVEDRIAFERALRREARSARRPPLPDPWRAAIRRAERVQRRHGADHRLTRRAWARAGAARNRMHKRITPYFTKYRPTEDLPW